MGPWKPAYCYSGGISMEGPWLVVLGTIDMWRVTGDMWHLTCDTWDFFLFLVLILLSAHIERLSVSHMQDFFSLCGILVSPAKYDKWSQQANNLNELQVPSFYWIDIFTDKIKYQCFKSTPKYAEHVTLRKADKKEEKKKCHISYIIYNLSRNDTGLWLGYSSIALLLDMGGPRSRKMKRGG